MADGPGGARNTSLLGHLLPSRLPCLLRQPAVPCALTWSLPHELEPPPPHLLFPFPSSHLRRRRHHPLREPHHLRPPTPFTLSIPPPPHRPSPAPPPSMRHPTAGGDAGFVRADQIDLKSLDEQLERHLGRPAERGGIAAAVQAGTGSRRGESARLGAEDLQTPLRRCREDWEIDPSKLVIKGVIARGTFGTVHRGVYDGQDVAVKLLDWGEDGHRSEQEISALRAAFAQEVAVWHKLDHPNVTKFIGAIMGARDLNIQTEHGHLGMPSNICCVVVEYLPGGALKNFLIKNRRRKLAFKVVVQIALDLARGLSYLHSEKIVHRDVKTENMLLDKTRTVKIADFGVARVEASNPSDMTGETGTLGYMAPEVLNGHPYNRKCDVYSFGICLWEVYCCDMPYPDLSFSEVTSAVVRQNLRPEIPRCCPSALANVMKRCWDANPDKRPEMAEVVSMLEAIDTSKGGGMIPKDQSQGCLSCFSRHRGP